MRTFPKGSSLTIEPDTTFSSCLVLRYACGLMGGWLYRVYSSINWLGFTPFIGIPAYLGGGTIFILAGGLRAGGPPTNELGGGSKSTLEDLLTLEIEGPFVMVELIGRGLIMDGPIGGGPRIRGPLTIGGCPTITGAGTGIVLVIPDDRNGDGELTVGWVASCPSCGTGGVTTFWDILSTGWT